MLGILKGPRESIAIKSGVSAIVALNFRVRFPEFLGPFVTADNSVTRAIFIGQHRSPFVRALHRNSD